MLGKSSNGFQSSFGGNRRAGNFQDRNQGFNRNRGRGGPAKPVRVQKPVVKKDNKDNQNQGKPVVPQKDDTSKPSDNEADATKKTDEKADADEENKEKDASKAAVKESSKTYCLACDIECNSLWNHGKHENTDDHINKVKELKANLDEKSVEILAKMKSQEHQREKDKMAKKPNFAFCKMCDMHTDIRLKEHCSRGAHKIREKQVQRGCGWCHVTTFKNYLEVLKHRESAEHISFQLQFQKLRKIDKNANTEMVSDEADIPEFQEGSFVGLTFVIPVMGFFCKLCNKFYQSEITAKTTHCGSENHYSKWKEFQLKRVEELKKAAEETAKAEEESKKKAEEMEKEEDMAEDKDTTEKLTNGTKNESMEADTVPEEEKKKDEEEDTDVQMNEEKEAEAEQDVKDETEVTKGEVAAREEELEGDVDESESSVITSRGKTRGSHVRNRPRGRGRSPRGRR